MSLTIDAKRYLIELASELADDVVEAPTCYAECRQLADDALYCRQDTLPCAVWDYPESSLVYLADCLCDTFECVGSTLVEAEYRRLSWLHD